MYFSYFRGRQYELLALKELAQKKLIGNLVIPVVEPIKMSSTFDSTIKAFSDVGLPLALIFNPAVGVFAGVDFSKSFQSIPKNIIHSIIAQDNMDDVILSLGKMGVRKEELLVVLNNYDFLDTYKTAFANDKPQYTLFPDERAIRRAVGMGKVIFDDKFKKQDKNADYAKNDDEFFSEEHLFFAEEGNVGFGDYSIIGNHYDESGFAPQAVAIHIVYFAEDKSLRIHHFVSDSNIGIEDVAGKFYEAVLKLSQWYKTQGDPKQKTFALSTLLDYADRGYYPGLPTIKKLSIMHHLELMSKYLYGGI